MASKTIKLRQIAIGPDNQLYALDIKGRVWVWHRVSKDWLLFDNPIEEDMDHEAYEKTVAANESSI